MKFSRAPEDDCIRIMLITLLDIVVKLKTAEPKPGGS